MCDPRCPDLSQRKSQGVGFVATAQSLRILVMMACLLAVTHVTAQINPKHFFWAPGQPNTPNDLPDLLGAGLAKRIHHRRSEWRRLHQPAASDLCHFVSNQSWRHFVGRD